MTRLAAGLLAGVALSLCAVTARAGDVEDFEVARRAYESRDYVRAVQYFEELVGGETPRLESRVLVLESRKYLAAAYLYVGRRDAARDQLERLLHDEPTYVLDPLAFPVEVLELFDAVRERLEHDASETQLRAALEMRARAAESRASRLYEVASAPVPVRVEHSRVLALVPFGVGQFQNDDVGLGVFFLSAQALFWASAIVNTALYAQLLEEVTRRRLSGAAFDPVGVNDLALGFYLADWLSVGLALVFTIAGIVEAQVSFVEHHYEEGGVDVPEDLAPPAEPSPSVSIGPGSLTLRF